MLGCEGCHVEGSAFIIKLCYCHNHDNFNSQIHHQVNPLLPLLQVAAKAAEEARRREEERRQLAAQLAAGKRENALLLGAVPSSLSAQSKSKHVCEAHSQHMSWDSPMHQQCMVMR